MKTMKKLLALTLAVVMVLSLAVTASAAGETPKNFTITVPSTDNHTYEVYQIFTGDLSENGSKLSNVKWGANGTGTLDEAVPEDVLTALTAVNGKSDSEKLAVIETYANLTGTAFGTVTKDSPLTAPAGYYLIKDVTELADGDTYTTYIVAVVKDESITRKASLPKVEKKVQDINDSVDTSAGNWQDSADHDIGDSVNFKLDGTLPSNLADYDKYQYIFHDSMSKGLTYNGDAKVYVVNGETKTEITTGFEISTSEAYTDGEKNDFDAYTGGFTLTVTFDDIKSVTGVTQDSHIVVEYTATLNENAEIGAAGNPNKVYLEYSRNPNVTGGGETTHTPEDVVIVFTYETIINKVDEEKKPLAGAEFTLEKRKADGTWTTLTFQKNTEGTVFTFTGLDDGIYRITETTTPDGYNTIDPIYFKVEAAHDVNSDNPGLTGLTVTVVDGTNFEAITDAKISFTATHSDGKITTDIVNKSGLELPETGGIGTTIFYIVGGLLTLGAVVLLVTKKKMSAAE